jgi:epoxyqueuosine reductase
MSCSVITKLTEKVKDLALSNDVDYVGIAPVDRFKHAPRGHRPSDLLPGAQSVVSIGTRIGKGTQLAQQIALLDRRFRHVAFSYRWFGYGLINMYFNDRAAFLVSRLLEKEGYVSVPIVGSGVEDMRNMMAAFSQRHAAVAAGLGEIGWNALCLTPADGPRQRFSSVITTAELEADPMYDGPRLCDPLTCSELGNGRPLCVAVCPLGLIRDNETVVADFGEKQFEYAQKDKVKCGGTIGLGIHPLVMGQDAPEIPDKVNMDTIAQLIERAPPFWKLETVAYGRGHFCGLCLLRCPVGRPQDIEMILEDLRSIKRQEGP